MPAPWLAYELEILVTLVVECEARHRLDLASDRAQGGRTVAGVSPVRCQTSRPMMARVAPAAVQTGATTPSACSFQVTVWAPRPTCTVPSVKPSATRIASVADDERREALVRDEDAAHGFALASPDAAYRVAEPNALRRVDGERRHSAADAELGHQRRLAGAVVTQLAHDALAGDGDERSIVEPAGER